MGRDRKHRNSKTAFINPHIQDTTVPHTVQTVILPPTISVWVEQAKAAWPYKSPETKSKPKPNPTRRLRIDPPINKVKLSSKRLTK